MASDIQDMKASLHRFRVSQAPVSSGNDIPSVPAPETAFRINKPRSGSAAGRPMKRSSSPPTNTSLTGAPPQTPAVSAPTVSDAPAAASALAALSAAGSGEDKEKVQSGSRPSRQTRDIPACDRCRRYDISTPPRLATCCCSEVSINLSTQLQEKCSRTFPVCTLCANAGQQCSFSISVTSAAAQTHHLKARIEWLSSFINENLPVGATGVELLETGVNLGRLRQSSSPPGSADRGLESATPSSGFSSHGVSNRHEAVPSQDHPMPDRQGPALKKEPILAPLPDDAAARRFVDGYFRNVKPRVPFVDRAKVLRDLETFGNFETRKRDPDSTLLFLVMAIGCTTLQRAGQIPADTADKFEVPYADIIQECLVREDIESVRILVLLALYSLFDTAMRFVLLHHRHRLPPGHASRPHPAMLGRQDYLGDRDRAAAPAVLEHVRVRPDDGRPAWDARLDDGREHRRSAPGSDHRRVHRARETPVCDDTADEPPGDPAAPDRGQDPQVCALLQELQGRVALHADRRAILEDIRAEIENWYSSGCLVSPLEPDNLPIHNSISWLSARYYHMLILLYYPSQFNPNGSVCSKTELLTFAQKHLPVGLGALPAAAAAPEPDHALPLLPDRAHSDSRLHCVRSGGLAALRHAKRSAWSSAFLTRFPTAGSMPSEGPSSSASFCALFPTPTPIILTST